MGSSGGQISGSAVFAGMEGTRPVLIEVQALVAPAVLAMPRRAVVGWDGTRLAMITAVLDARCGLAVGANDIYLNIAGGLRIVELPMPRPVIFDGQRLPASYANFYIANGLVLVPTFNDPADRIALDTLAVLFPDREVVGIHSVDLVLGLGTLHCLSQQQPAGSIL